MPQHLAEGLDKCQKLSFQEFGNRGHLGAILDPPQKVIYYIKMIQKRINITVCRVIFV